MKSISIFSSFYDSPAIIKNEYIHPILIGADNRPHVKGNFLRDNDGDNISRLAFYYKSVTSHYWAWKNDNSEYVGIFNDLRYLSLSESESDKSYDAVLDFEELVINHGYGPDMADTISKYDMIVSKEDSLSTSNKANYCSVQGEVGVNQVLNLIKEHSPEMYDVATEYFESNSGHYSNMFIMKRQYFEEYSAWLFKILFNVQLSEGNTNKRCKNPIFRILAERMLGIYIRHKKKMGNLKIKETAVLEVLNKGPFTINPVFGGDSCNIVISSNDFYIPYVSVLIESILDNYNPNRNYDFVILSSDATEKSKKILTSMGKENVSIRFFDMSSYMRSHSELPTHDHISIETYFRYFIPEILEKYSKALYLDVDLVAVSDVNELFEIDIDNHLLAATVDADFVGCYEYIEGRKEYVDNSLKMKDPCNYFQAGVLLLNLEKIRAELSRDKLLELSQSQHWIHLDQDVLNYVCQGRVKYIDMSWDVLYDLDGWRSKIIPLAPYHIYNEYLNARANPKIIHYAGQKKPWRYPSVDFGEVFWKYARKSPFYELIVKRMLDDNEDPFDSMHRRPENELKRPVLLRKFVIHWMQHGLLATIKAVKNRVK